MNKKVKRAFYRMITLVCFIISISYIHPSDFIKAGVINYYEDTSAKQAYANMGIKVPFKVIKQDITEIAITSNANCNVTATLYDNNLQVFERQIFTPDMAEYNKVNGAYIYKWYPSVKYGASYDLEVIFSESTSYQLKVGPLVSTINKKSATITKGFKVTLDVEGEPVIKWKSSNTKVATVSKGVVTGKGKGTATITATLSSGKTLKSKITVKNNEYIKTKKTLKKSKLGQTAQVYKAYYSKGKIVLKVHLVNNWDAKYNQLEKINITLKTKKGDVIGTYKSPKKNLKISPNSTKDITLEINKPKDKYADLRKAKVNVKMTFGYRERNY